MAEPTIQLELNEGTEGAPTWAAIETALRVTGPDAADGALDDPWPAPVADGTDAFADDDASAPNDGEFWHEKAAADAQITLAGRKGNQNVLRANETGGTDGTADPPELTAYDDATDGQNRTNPTLWLLAGTIGTSNISCLRAIETLSAGVTPGVGWTGQAHDSAPSEGNPLDGDQTNEKVVCTSALAAGGSKEFQVAACLPHDATAGLSTYIWQLQYTFT